MENYNIPSWCKDAVLTDRGVASMLTGELYISKKGAGDIPYKNLQRDISLLKGAGKSGQTPNCCKVKEEPVKVEKVEEPAKVEEPVIVEPTPVEEPVKAPVKKTTAKKPTAKKSTAKKAPVKKDA